MHYSETHFEPLVGFPAEARWRLIEALHDHRRRRAKSLRRRAVSIERLQENYLHDLRDLLGEDKFGAYQKFRKKRRREMQKRRTSRASATTTLTASQVKRIRKAVRFIRDADIDREKLRKLGRKYLRKAARINRVSQGREIETSGKKKSVKKSRRRTTWLQPPFLEREVEYDINTTEAHELSNVTANISIAEGTLRHESHIEMYFPDGWFNKTCIDNRLGFAAIIEAPPGWTSMNVKAQFTNNHSCSMWAQWDECGLSDYRQDFTCQAYLRLHGFWPFENPLLREENGLELVGTSHGGTGELVLQSPGFGEGTIEAIPPVHSFWAPGETLETAWTRFDGPSTFTYLTIWAGIDCSHRAFADDYSLFSELLVNLRLKSIQVEFNTG